MSERVTLVLSLDELRALLFAVQVGRAEMVGSAYDRTEELEARLQALLPERHQSIAPRVEEMMRQGDWARLAIVRHV